MKLHPDYENEKERPVKKFGMGSWEGFTEIDSKLTGQWVIPKDAGGTIIHDGLEYVEQAVQHDASGQRFGVVGENRSPINLDTSEVISDKTILMYDYNKIDPTLQEKFKHVYEKAGKLPNQEEPKVTVKNGVEDIDGGTAEEVTNRTTNKKDEAKTVERIERAEKGSERVASNADNKDTYTTGTLAKDTVEDMSDREKLSRKRFSRWSSVGKAGGAIGIGAFALASLVDTNENLSDKRELARRQESQERDFQKKQTQQRREQAKEGYGYTTPNDLVAQMWNDRIGHYKMGNAKYQ
jgi:hypothetical protein